MSARDPIKVYDARWEVHEFDDAAVVRLFEATFAYARELSLDTVTLARDGRLGAAHVLELAMETAVRLGFRTIVCPDPISTTQGYFLALQISREHPKTMGLVITASHNPKQYIGVKFTVPVVQAIGADCGPMGGLSAIRRIYHSDERFAARPGGSLLMVNLTREYIAFSMREAGTGAAHDLAGMRIVLDGFHGAAGPELMTALQLAGAHVEPLRILPDGNFPTGSPNPTSQGKMARAVALAAEKDCDAVIGLDGDGDRIVFGDYRGILNAGFAAIPILRACVHEKGVRDLLPERPAGCCAPKVPEPFSTSEGLSPFRNSSRSDKFEDGDCPFPAAEPHVLYDPKVNPLALAEWGKLGVHPVLFRNGHSQIKDYMRQIGAVAAAEESGHYYHRIADDDLVVCCENSILTILLFLRSLKQQPQLMDELWAMQAGVRTTGEFNYQFADDAARDRAMAAVIALCVADGATTVTATPDGIDLQGTVISKGVNMASGVSLDSGWYSGYLRIATNEKAVVRSYFSAADPDVLHRLESDTRRILAEQFNGVVID